MTVLGRLRDGQQTCPTPCVRIVVASFASLELGAEGGAGDGRVERRTRWRTERNSSSGCKGRAVSVRAGWPRKRGISQQTLSRWRLEADSLPLMAKQQSGKRTWTPSAYISVLTASGPGCPPRGQVVVFAKAAHTNERPASLRRIAPLPGGALRPVRVRDAKDYRNHTRLR